MNGKVKVLKKGPKGGKIRVLVGDSAIVVKAQLKSKPTRNWKSVVIEGKKYDVAINGSRVVVSGNGSNDTYTCPGDVQAMEPITGIVIVVAIVAVTYLADKMIDKMDNVDQFSTSVSVGEMAISVEASGSGGDGLDEGNTSDGDDGGNDDSGDNGDSGDDDGGDSDD